MCRRLSLGVKLEHTFFNPTIPSGQNTRTQAVSKEENNTSWGLWHVSLVRIEID